MATRVNNIRKLILVRHGQSTYNLENRFTGWVDVDLSEKGILEAQKSGQLIKNLNIDIDTSYTSFLKRAVMRQVIKKVINILLAMMRLGELMPDDNNPMNPDRAQT